MYRHEPKPLLSFEAVLSSQLDGSVSYSTMKRMLRTLKASSTLPYPRPRVQTLSQRFQLSQSVSRTAELSLTRAIQKTKSMGLSLTPSQDVATQVNGREETEKQENDMDTSRLRRKRRSSKRKVMETPLTPKLRDDARNGGQDDQGPSQDLENINVCLFPSNSEIDHERVVGEDKDEDREGDYQRGDLAESHQLKERLEIKHDEEITASEVGEYVNAKLNALVAACEQGKAVTWADLRTVVARDNRLTQFCQFVDSVFQMEDTLATGPTYMDGCDIPLCVCYSNLFWEKAWLDFVLTVSAMSR